jgi:hypothetical protein
VSNHVEINVERRTLYILLGLLITLALVGLGALGRSYTPDPARLVGWSDWTALKVERRYRRELAALREDLTGLADLLLASNPDPVRAELAAARIAQQHADSVRPESSGACAAAGPARAAGGPGRR